MFRIMTYDLFPIVLAIKWDPHQARLAVATGTSKLYMWSPAGSLSVEVPVEGIKLFQF